MTQRNRRKITFKKSMKQHFRRAVDARIFQSASAIASRKKRAQPDATPGRIDHPYNRASHVESQRHPRAQFASQNRKYFSSNHFRKKIQVVNTTMIRRIDGPPVRRSVFSKMQRTHNGGKRHEPDLESRTVSSSPV